MNNLKEEYLDLLKKTLSFTLWDEPLHPIDFAKSDNKLKAVNNAVYNLTGCHLAVDAKYSREDRESGKVWPILADTMVGLKRLDNLQYCCESVINEGIEGDFIETGVLRGGACIFMRAVLKAYGVQNREVIVADSFQGLPKSDMTQDGQNLNEFKYLSVSQEQVENNFKRYGLLDSQVVFLNGWFKDTLPTLNNKFAVIRLDGDLYESTMDALSNLYPKLTVGGYCIIDDYFLSGCRKAVDEYREKNNIASYIIIIDEYSCYWRKI